MSLNIFPTLKRAEYNQDTNNYPDGNKLVKSVLVHTILSSNLNPSIISSSV